MIKNILLAPFLLIAFAVCVLIAAVGRRTA